MSERPDQTYELRSFVWPAVQRLGPIGVLGN